MTHCSCTSVPRQYSAYFPPPPRDVRLRHLAALDRERPPLEGGRLRIPVPARSALPAPSVPSSLLAPLCCVLLAAVTVVRCTVSHFSRPKETKPHG